MNVTHSIPDALAVFVQTPAGSLIDTGDIKLDQLPLDHRITDLVEFGKLGEKGVDLLMMDSTNAEVPGFVKPETTIGPALDQAFAQATRKIIVASFSSTCTVCSRLSTPPTSTVARWCSWAVPWFATCPSLRIWAT